jgi:polyhydroxyalkanoate synthesis regulator phasin
LEGSLDYYKQNQDFLDKDSDKLQSQQDEIRMLKEQLRTLESKDGGRRRVESLIKQNQELTEALKTRNPNSLPAMISAAKPSVEESSRVKALKEEIKDLRQQLGEKDDDKDKAIRKLKLQTDKTLAHYK